MKKSFFILVLLFGGTIILAGCSEWLTKRQPTQQPMGSKPATPNPQRVSVKMDKTLCNKALKVEDIATIEMLESGTIRYHIDTNRIGNDVLTPENILTCYKYLWQLGQFDSILADGTHNKRNMYTHKTEYIEYFYKLYYKGFKIDDISIRVVKSITNKIYQIQFMNYLSAPINVSFEHIINTEQAEDIGVYAKAKTHDIYWLYAKECFEKGTCGQDFLDGYKPNTKLIIRYANELGNYKLQLMYKVSNVWLSGLSEEGLTENAIEIWRFFIDAHSGKIIKSEETSND